MRAVKFAMFAALAVAFVGCNNQPLTYRIAIDASPLNSLPPSCYRNNYLNQDRTTTNNLREERQWVVWNGVENKQYLDIGSMAVTLGHADPIDVGDLIEGSDKVFSGQVVTQHLPEANGYTNTKTTTLTVTFDDMGATAKGSIDATSLYTCTNCQNNDNKVSCQAKFNFTGRRVDTAATTYYDPSGGSI